MAKIATAKSLPPNRQKIYRQILCRNRFFATAKFSLFECLFPIPKVTASYFDGNDFSLLPNFLILMPNKEGESLAHYMLYS